MDQNPPLEEGREVKLPYDSLDRLFDSQNIISKMLFNISKIFNNTWYMTKTVEKS